MISLLTLCAALAAGQGTAADERIILHTSQGNIVITLYPEAAPRHVQQVLRLARLGAYDSVPIARILPGYLIQFAGVRGRRLALQPGQSAGLTSLPLEPGGLRHTRGTLTMSRDPRYPDSGESSFSILLKDSPHLDGRYTAFGRVERGWEALDAIAALPLSSDKQPQHWTEITRARVVPASQVDTAIDAWPEPARGQPPRGGVLGLLLLIFAFSAGAALLNSRPEARGFRAACLLNALLAFFAMLVATLPSLPTRGPLPVALFASALTLFRLLATFEPPEKA